MALGAPRWLGAVTPLGGLLVIAGFLLVAWEYLRLLGQQTDRVADRPRCRPAGGPATMGRSSRPGSRSPDSPNCSSSEVSRAPSIPATTPKEEAPCPTPSSTSPSPRTNRSRATHRGHRSAPRLEGEISHILGEETEIPLVIGGREVRTGNTAKSVCPHDHGHVLATYHQAGAAEVALAVEAAADAGPSGPRWGGRPGRPSS